MASALVAGLLRAGGEPNSILMVEPDQAQRKRLRERFGVQVLASSGAELGSADVVVWAVKPQVLADAIRALRPHVSSALHISIAAGIATALQQWLQSDRVVRVMPNTPALIGLGVTGMLAIAGVSASDRQVVENVFGPTGTTFWVDSDDRIDAVTAVTGSGPGYVFQILASYQAAAERLGFSPEQARDLVLRTCAGAVAQGSTDATPLTELRDRVASKGGTTEAGLKVLERYEIDSAMRETLRSAYTRAGELSAQLSASSK
jgi:pyrroline-5-carboxylate reductase